MTNQVKALPDGLFIVPLQVGAILNTDDLLAINTNQVVMMAQVSSQLINRAGGQRNLVNQPDITQQVQVTVHGVHADSRQLPAHSPVYFPNGQAAAGPAQNLNNLPPLGR
ncbi:MAG: hypothetical protein DDT21_00688 [Syntrophomonadaceae bacterium]|nr:hypothetical protein [Bacillota bacterium]